jgi:hypothetical protein
MKVNASIFSAVFVLVVGLLHIQPLFLNYEGKTEQRCTKTPEPVCAKKSRCPMQQQAPSPEEKDCDNNGCNPFVPCSMGACCYLVESMFTYSLTTIVSTQKIALFNDNRISDRLSECWHPPEFVS